MPSPASGRPYTRRCPRVRVETDVSKADNVEALAQRSLAAFGAIHLGNVRTIQLSKPWLCAC